MGLFENILFAKSSKAFVIIISLFTLNSSNT